MKTGIELITQERTRQIEVEGFTDLKDEDYTAMQLSGAAGCYIASAQQKYFEVYTHGNEDGKYTRFQIYQDGYWPRSGKYVRAKWVDGWPWSKEWDKRDKHNVRRSLVIAGALIAAELDRLSDIQDI